MMNLKGEKFGKWTVIEKAEDYVSPQGIHKPKWKCLCSCGGTKNIFQAVLKNGKSTSCGCVHKGFSIKIIEHKEFAEVFKYSRHVEYARFLIDSEDIWIMKKYKWNINSNGYASAKVNGKNIRLHRLLMNPPKGMDIDHINRNRLDNRKENLRICTRTQNLRNMSMRGGSSKYKGVSFFKSRGKWESYINYKGKRIKLGYFKTENEAALAYNKKAFELDSEFALLNKVTE